MHIQVTWKLIPDKEMTNEIIRAYWNYESPHLNTQVKDVPAKNWQQHTLVKSEKKQIGEKGNYKEKFRWNYSNKATLLYRVLKKCWICFFKKKKKRTLATL